MVQCYKRKGKSSFDSDISSPEGKKICESPCSDPNINTASDEGEDDHVLEALNMTERIASQLEMTLASVENRLQRLKGISERFSVLESSINSLQTGLSTLSEKSRIIEEKTNYIEKAVEFENAEIEELKKKDKENEDKIKELEDKLLYQEVYNRRENFFGIPESTTSAENTFEVMCNFLKEELDLENAENIEFQRAHRIGKKKTGEARPVIVRFSRFPESELVFRKVRELQSDTDVKVYSDLPKEISERRKRQWPRLKKAREEGKIAFFSKPEPDKLFIDGQFVPL